MRSPIMRPQLRIAPRSSVSPKPMQRTQWVPYAMRRLRGCWISASPSGAATAGALSAALPADWAYAVPMSAIARTATVPISRIRGPRCRAGSLSAARRRRDHKCAFEAGVAVDEGGVIVRRVLHRQYGWRIRVTHRRYVVPLANGGPGLRFAQHRKDAAAEQQVAACAIDHAHGDDPVAHVGGAAGDPGLRRVVLSVLVVGEEVDHRRGVARRLC